MIKLLTALFLLVFFYGCSDSINSASLQSVSYTPDQDYLIKGRNTTIKAIANYDDGSTKDMSAELIWESSNSAIASVSGGEVSALAEGMVNISYKTKDTLPSGDAILEESIAFEVVDAQPISIAVSPNIIYKNQKTKLITNGTFNINGANVSLSLSDLGITSDKTSVIRVLDNSYIEGIEVGTANITARDDDSNVSKTISIEVQQNAPDSIRVSRDDSNYDNDSFSVSDYMQLKAIARYEDGEDGDITKNVTWKSSDNSIVLVDEFGEAEALATGSVIITATLNGLDSNEYSLSVSP
jgi:uncharacterized protein YjdB